jgi:TPR repeat protein
MNHTKGLYSLQLNGRRQALRLDAVPLASGADGAIHLIKGDDLHIAKLYHDPGKDTTRLSKLKAMLGNPPDLPVITIDNNRYVQLAWPNAWIENRNGRFVGYTMPKVDMSSAVSLEVVISAKTRKLAKIPDFLGYRLTAGFNLASLVAELHRHGHHIIDLKPINLNVYKKSFYMSVLDCDGFSIDSGNAERYPAHQYSDGYIAPEALQSRATPQELGEDQDRFALAVIIFQLLNQGLHPYQGVPTAGANVPITNSERIQSELYAYGRRPNRLLGPSPWSIHDYFDDDTRTLFDRAFSSKWDRPTALEWSQHLREYAKEGSEKLKQCSRNPQHAHFSKGCPWCAIEDRAAAERKPRKRSASRIKTIRPRQSPQIRLNVNITHAKRAGLTLALLFGAYVSHYLYESTLIRYNAYKITDSANRGDYAELNALVNNGVDIDMRGPSGDTALALAVKNGNKTTTQKLLELGANPNIPDSTGIQLVNLAITRGHRDIALALIAGSDHLEIINPQGISLIELAQQKKQFDVLEAILKKGSILHTLGINSQRPYRTYSLIKNRIKALTQNEQLRELYLRSVDYELRRRVEMSDLAIAVMQENENNIIKHRGNNQVRQRDANNMTAIDVAIAIQKPELIPSLLPARKQQRHTPNSDKPLPEDYFHWKRNVRLKDGSVASELTDELFEQLTSTGDAEDYRAVGLLSAMRYGDRSAEKNALKYLRLAAEGGNALAKYDLALCYHRGIMVKADSAKAIALYREAAEAGIQRAAIDLSILLWKTRKIDTVEYSNQLSPFANKGDPYAQYMLGRYQTAFLSISDTKRPLRSKKYIIQSIKNGYPAAAFSVGKIINRNFIAVGAQSLNDLLSKDDGSYDYMMFLDDMYHAREALISALEYHQVLEAYSKRKKLRERSRL